MAKISFTLIPARVKSDGTNRVRLYISHHSKVKYLPTDIFIRGDQWRNGVVVNHPHAKQMNMKLNQLMGKYLSTLYGIENIDSYSCDQVADILSDNVEVFHRKVSDVLDKFISTYNETNRETTGKMNRAGIELFTSYAGDIELVTITNNTLKDYNKFLEKKGLSSTTQLMRLQQLRSFLRYCVNEKLVCYQEFPFKGFKFPKCRRRETQITIAELKTIASIKSASTTLCAMRDIFMLSFYLGGMNLVDMFQMDYSKDTLRFKRQKVKTRTDHWTVIPIVPEAREIIERNIMPDGTLCFGKYNCFSKASYACTNNMHRLAEAAGITSRFMFYSARKTFVQIGVKELIPLNVLEYCIGETPKGRNPIEAYYVIDKDVAEEAMRKIFDTLKDIPKN